MSTYKSCLHTSPEKIFRKLDVDTKESHHILELQVMLKNTGIHPYLVVESRAGYHVILHNELSFISEDKNQKDEMNKALYTKEQRMDNNRE